MPKCAYSGLYHNCQEEEWGNSPKGMCIYHDEENGKDEETARKVWDDALARIATAPTFVGWHFPGDPGGRGFRKAQFAEDASFAEAHFDGDALFGGAHFARNALFIGVQFKGKAMFPAARFDGEASLVEAHFDGEAWFDGAQFDGTAWFGGAQFNGLASFVLARFGSAAWFGEAHFHGEAAFSGAQFGGPALFSDVLFDGDASFGGAHVSSGVAAFFPPPNWEVPCVASRPFAKREQGESAYRLAKQAAQNAGDYRQAGLYHYAEQCAIEHGRRMAVGCKVWRLRFWSCIFECIFARVIFGYGEKVWHSLATAVGVITLFTGLYWYCAMITYGATIKPDIEDDPYQPTVVEALHFSVVTFTTTGYGDLAPKKQWRLVADCEALAGASLMAVFVVTLTRRYMR